MEQAEPVASPSSATLYPTTPDGKYFVVKRRLWRRSDPRLDEAARTRLVKDLMAARRAVRNAGEDRDARSAARQQVNAAKVGLGERGPVWWDDGEPDYNRKLAKNTPYREWFTNLPPA